MDGEYGTDDDAGQDDAWTIGALGEARGTSRWERRITTGGKALRGASAFIVVTLALLIILAASGVRVWPLLRAALGDPAVPYAMDEAAPTQVFTGARPVALGVGQWQRLSLPLTAGKRLADYQPSRGGPQTIFACTAPADLDEVGFIRGPVTLWRTRDAGARWTTLALPPLIGSDCAVVTASDSPARLALLVMDPRQPDPSAQCMLYLSGDAGQTWTHAPHNFPDAAEVTVNSCAIWLSARSLFLLSTYRAPGRDSAMRATRAMLERTDDNGRMWTRADADLGADIAFASLTVSGDTLIAGVNRTGARNGVGEVWISHDAGRHWGHTSNLGGVATIQRSASSPYLLGDGAGPPLYAVYQQRITATVVDWQIARSVDGQSWETLPPQPITRASEPSPFRAGVVGATRDGALLVLSADPGESVGEFTPPASWLWIWQPASARWEGAPTPVRCDTPAAGPLCNGRWSLPRIGASTSSPQASSWLYLQRQSVWIFDGSSWEQRESAPSLYRIALPSA
jgi:hypothetical protein